MEKENRTPNPNVYLDTNEKTKKIYKNRKSLNLTLVRYADDFVVIHEEKMVIEKTKEYISEWLKVRGLELSEEKKKIVHSSEGFEFLGHNIKHYKNKIKGTYKLKLLKGTPNEKRRAMATDAQRIEPTKQKVKNHWKLVIQLANIKR